MPTVCLVRNCSTTYLSAPNVRLHYLPGEQHRRALWLRAIDRDGPDDIGDRVGHLCSNHFLPGDYETNIQVRQSLGLDTEHARLKSDAVPTQNLWFNSPPRKRRRSERTNLTPHPHEPFIPRAFKSRTGGDKEVKVCHWLREDFSLDQSLSVVLPRAWRNPRALCHAHRAAGHRSCPLARRRPPRLPTLPPLKARSSGGPGCSLVLAEELFHLGHDGVVGSRGGRRGLVDDTGPMAWAARCGGGRCCGGRRGGGFDGGGCGSRCGGTVFGRPGWLDGGQGSGSQEVRAACPQGLDRCRHVVREGLCLQQVRMESTCFVGFQMYYRDPAQPAGVRRSQDPWRRRLRVATEREWDLVVGLARRWSGLMLPTPAGNEVDRPSFLPRRPRGHGVAGGPTPGRSPGRRRTRSVVRGLRRGRPCLVPRCCCGRPCPVPRRPAGCRARGTCGARAALARSAVRPSPVLTPPWAAAPRVWSTGPLGSSRPGAWPVRWASWVWPPGAVSPRRHPV
ncbi:uncharacterized protein ISCGN_013124 [Ixodes scapularis]